jgi:hypothetical protein
LVTLTIDSQPLVLSAKADDSGNWTYTLEQPLEPGKHEAYVEVNVTDKVEKSGPYPFSIARAQASADNPLGSSFNLIDPRAQEIKNYLYLAGLLVGLGLLALLITLYIKRTKKLAAQNPNQET